jgi:hypothetical protein
MDETDDTLLDSSKKTARDLAVGLHRDSKGDARERLRECIQVFDGVYTINGEWGKFTVHS